MGTHSVPMIAMLSSTAAAPRVAGVLREGAGWAIAVSQDLDGRCRSVTHAVTRPPGAADPPGHRA
jgi:hypothetical protein